MNKIFLLGDTHWGTGDENKLLNLTVDNNDLVIICGDCGALFVPELAEQNLQQIAKIPCDVLFLDGNHENFDLIYQYPVVPYCGGMAHQILPNFYHLMRGEAFTFFGKTFFVFGGAASLDKHMRTEGVSWWKEEIPTNAQIEHGIATLDKYNNEFDYILTHTAPLSVVKELVYYKQDHDHNLLQFFDMIAQTVKFKHWYFGHFHEDKRLAKFTCLYKIPAVIEGETNNSALWELYNSYQKVH